MLLYLSMLDTQEEKDKFTEIYEQYQHFCWYIANGILNDAHLSEDAVQDAFLALTRHLDKVEEVDSPKTRKFLMTIVKSKAIDLIRKDKGEVSLSQEDMGAELLDEKPDLLSAYITQENYNKLIACVLELDEIYRVVFEYKYLHELSDQEIADILNISAKTVNVRFYRARKKLQEMIQKEVAGYGK